MPPGFQWSHRRDQTYKHHPLYWLRFWNILIAGLGVFFSLFALLDSDSYSAGAYTTGLFCLLVSVAFCLWDLITWSLRSTEKKEREDRAARERSAASETEETTQRTSETEPEDPTWPRKALLIGDALLALILFWASGVIFSGIGYGYTYRDPVIVVCQAWAVLCAALCCGLHTWVFWKELMARKRKQWTERLVARRLPCVYCGFRDEAPATLSVPPSPRQRQQQQEQNAAGAADGAGARSFVSKSRLPAWLRGVKTVDKNSAVQADPSDLEAGNMERNTIVANDTTVANARTDSDDRAPLLVTPEPSSTSPSSPSPASPPDGSQQQKQGYSTMTRLPPDPIVPDVAGGERVVTKKGKTRMVETERA